jgi:cytosine permease
METKQNWLQLTNIQIGGAICLPVIMIGQILGQNYGFENSIAALIIGNLLLMILGVVAVQMSVKTRLSTMENAAHYFGKYGTRLFAIVMVICLVGWFAIQLNLMSLSINNILQLAFKNVVINNIIINIALGLLITSFTLHGITALDKIASISMPLLIFTMSYSVYSVATSPTLVLPSIVPNKNILDAISLVIATAIAVVADLPTYYRFARSKKDGLISIILLFSIAIPAIECVGVYIGSYSSGGTIIDTLLGNGGTLWQLWVGLFLILAGWTTNNANLYSAAVSGQIIVPKIKENIRIFIIGALGTALACLDVIKNFETVLEVMGIMITSMAAIMLSCFVLKELHIAIYKINHFSLLCWALSTLFGFLSFFKIITLTGIGTIDAWIAAVILIILLTILNLIFKK